MKKKRFSNAIYMQRGLWSKICMLLLFSLLAVGISTFLISVFVDAAPPDKAKWRIRILGYPMGQAGYSLSLALSQIINKYSDTLYSDFTSGTSSSANQLYLIKNAEARKNTVIITNQVAVWAAKNAVPPFEERFYDLRCISSVVINPNTFVTLDPNIKQLGDIAGKRVAIGPKGSGIWDMPYLILEHMGLVDKVKLSGMTLAAIKDALLAGTVDVGFLSGTYMGDETVVPIAATEEVMRLRTLYWISVPLDVMKAVEQKYGMFMGGGKWTVPAIGKTPAQTFTAPVSANSWWVHKDFPDEIVTEILSVLYAHIEEMGQYDVSGKAMKRETMGRVPAEEAEFHPAALKFYRTKGLKVGWW